MTLRCVAAKLWVWCRSPPCSSAGRFFLPEETDEDRLVDAAVEGLGLTQHHQFDPEKHIIEWALNSVVKK